MTTAQIEPETDHLDPASDADGKQKQLLISGILLLALFSAVLFWQTSSVDFLLDDYFHVDYLYQAFNGAPYLILRPFFGNLSFFTDSLTSYRPLLPVFFAIDYAFWGANAAGFHITNMVMFAGCCMLTPLIGWELLAIFELPRKALPPLFAGLLFAVYPLHVESVAWIVGRCDVQCLLFYMLAMYSYLRHRQSRKRYFLYVGAGAFLCALTSKEMAVTLPAVLSLLEIAVLQKSTSRQFKIERAKPVLLFWAVLIAFAILRTALIGTLVGGYGAGDFKTLSRSLGNFADSATLLKLLFGSSSEVKTPQHLGIITYTCLALSGLIWLAKSLLDRRLLRLNAFLLLWTIISVAPAFQIWHISPNLVGGRLFFLGSLPFCLLLTLSVLTPSARPVSKSMTLSMILLSGGILSLLALAWGLALTANLAPWLEAGQLMRSLRTQIQEIAGSNANELILLADLPHDHRGAPLLGRPEFLATISKPPFSEHDFSHSFITAERPIPGGYDNVYPGVLQTLRKSAKRTYVWSARQGRYVEMAPEQPPIETAINAVDIVWQNFPGNKVGWWPNMVLPGDNGFIVAVECESGANSRILPQLIWRGQLSGEATNQLDVNAISANTLLYAPARRKNWTLNNRIDQIGLRLYDGCATRIKTIRLLKRDRFEPKISFAEPAGNADSQWLFNIDKQQPLSVEVDARALDQAQSIMVYVSKSAEALPDEASMTAPDAKITLWSKQINAPHGKVIVPAALIADGHIHQVGALALSAAGKPVGFCSEPRAFKMASKISP